MRVRIWIAAWMLAAGVLPVQAEEAPKGALAAMEAPIKELGTFLSNARFKLGHGVSGMGGSGGGFSIKDCCSINVDRMRTALDTMARERTDLLREYERARNGEGVAKLDPLSTSLKSFEEGYKLLLAAKQPDQAMSVLDGLLKSFHAMEAAHKDLVACCAPPEK